MSILWPLRSLDPLLGLFLLAWPRVGAAQQAELTALLTKHHVPGMQVVYMKGAAVTAYNLGVRQAGTTQAVDANTVFQAASLGKVVEAYIALRLCDRGLLDLDKSLLAYCAYPRLAQEPRAARITARMVLRHTTGLPNWAEYPFASTWKTSALHLKYAPDSCWNYSGEGFVLLQKVLEQLTSKSFETLAQEEIFRPLHLPNSSFVWRDKFAAHLSVGHDSKSQPSKPVHYLEPYGAYSLLTTALDYQRFIQALATGRGLKPTTARLLRTPASPADRCGQPASPADPAIAWACGVGLATTSQGLAQWHWGNNDDFKGFFMTLPGKQESVLMLTNSANGSQLTDDVLQLFFGPGTYWAPQWLAE